jgi:dipeptidyl aminopeptidase/acylaminoacyl peptidase
MKFRQSLVVLALGALLVACGGPQLTPVPTVVPTTSATEPTPVPATAVPTSAPTVAAPTSVPTIAPPVPTVAPTSAPTSVPGPPAILPAPLYLLEGGQVMRVERDGASKTRLTTEQPMNDDGALAIIDLAVSPAGDTLAYIVQVEGGNTLVLTDANGDNRRVLLENVGISAPRWSPDGSALAVQLWSQNDLSSPWQDGVWVVSAFSGEARQLIANDPVPANGTGVAWGYSPDSWSPDGKKLLVSRFSLVAEFCEAAILGVDAGDLVLLQAPAERTPPLRVQCNNGAWAADSSGVYVAVRGPGLAPTEPGLYFANAATSAMVPAIAPTQAEGKYNLVQAQHVSADGVLYTMIAQVDRIPDLSVDANPPPLVATLYRVAPDGTLEAVRQEGFALYGIPVWTADDQGFMLPTLREDGGVNYFYVPLEGEAVPLRIEPTTGIGWGR